MTSVSDAKIRWKWPGSSRLEITVLAWDGRPIRRGLLPGELPTLQEAFLGAGFRPFDYVPAWNKDPRTGLHIDHVVFGWSNTKPDTVKIALTAKSAALAASMDGKPLP